MLASRLTRSAILVAAGAAIAVQLWLASYAWPDLPRIGAVAFVFGIVAGRRTFPPGYWLLLGILYIYPIAIYPYAGVQPGFAGVVLAGAFGLSLGMQRRWEWSLPAAWSVALSLSALAIALTWPIVAAREIDFRIWLLFVPRQAVSWQGIPPHVQIGFLTGVAAMHLVGVIFLDALVGRFRDDRSAFERLVLAPLVVTATAAAAIAAWQMAVDVRFLNPTIYASLGRASATMLDANAFGTVAAMLAAPAAWLTARHAGRFAAPLSGLVFVLFASAVWATGSRTATLALLVAVPFALFGLARELRARFGIRHLAAGAVLVVAAGIAAVTLLSSSVVGPVSRLRELRSAGGPWPEMIAELRDRGGYGISARDMIADHPVTGVGVGTFHALVLDYAKRERAVMLTPDNAQNWFRHQVAEIGWVGAAGYFLWTALLAGFAMRRLTRAGPAFAVAAGGLAGLLVASLFGMPTQDVTVLLTFCVFVAWMSISADDLPAVASRPRVAAIALSVAGLVAIGFAAATAYVAVERLRVPFRAAQTLWRYEYGFHGLDTSTSPAFRWTRERAVAVVEPSGGKFLKLVFRVQHPDVASNPVTVKIKLFNRTIVRERFVSTQPMVRYIEVPGDVWLPLTFEVSRTFTPGGGDTRALGLAVDDWTYVDTPPPDAWIIR